jgi:hypothetical protein
MSHVSVGSRDDFSFHPDPSGPQGDFNISPVIFANGSALFLYRYGGGTPYNSHLRLGTATHWRNVSSYVQHNHTDLFPEQGSGVRLSV